MDSTTEIYGLMKSLEKSLEEDVLFLGSSAEELKQEASPQENPTPDPSDRAIETTPEEREINAAIDYYEQFLRMKKEVYPELNGLAYGQVADYVDALYNALAGGRDHSPSLSPYDALVAYRKGSNISSITEELRSPLSSHETSPTLGEHPAELGSVKLIGIRIEVERKETPNSEGLGLRQALKIKKEEQDDTPSGEKTEPNAKSENIRCCRCS